jgi:uncharacterized membrane protein
MAHELEWAKQVAWGALAGTTAAACVIPTAWPIVGMMYTFQCDPDAILTAGRTWSDLAAEFGKTADELGRLATEIPPESWTGGDRTEFDQRISEYRTRFTLAQVLAVTVAVALILMAMLLVVLILLMAVIAAVLLVFEALILACLAGVVSAPAAAEIFVEADAIALESAELLESSGDVVTGIGQGLAGAISQAMEVDVVGQLFNGDTHLGHDLLQTVLDGSDTVFWGTLARVEQQATGHLMGAGNPFAVTKGVSDAIPYSVATPTITSVAQNEATGQPNR